MIASLIAMAAIAQAEPATAAANPAADAAVRRVMSSQVTVRSDRDGNTVRFRATILGIAGDRLTLLTAGHCLEPGAAGVDVTVAHDQRTFPARVESVTRNPAFDPDRNEAPGADIAVIRLVATAEALAPIAATPPLPLAEIATPDRSGRAIRTFIVDQTEEARVVRGGNFSNPRWLEWGPAYRPNPGDSGSGVFVFRRGAADAIEPMLIGVVVVRSSSGGGAALLSTADRWLARALRPASAVTAPTSAPAVPGPASR